jgi:hypothetical protein
MNDTTFTLKTFLDPIGRTILGEYDVEKTNEQVLAVKNAVVLHVVSDAQQAGKMSVQLLPLFFREFLGDKTSDVTFFYPQDKIVALDIEALDFRLQAQYGQLFSKTNIFIPPTQEVTQAKTDKVISLFDEE